MKKFILIFCLFLSTLSAFEPTKPFTGHPCLIGKSVSLSLGEYTLSMTPPSGWGVGEMDFDPEGTSLLTLCPGDGGHGAFVKISAFESEAAAQMALKKMKRTFDSTTPLGNGFEVEFKKRWYCCKTTDHYLIEMWYSLPKKTKAASQNWNTLKNCVTLERDEVEPEFEGERPPIEKISSGWVCHHPENNTNVYFESSIIQKSSKNEDPSKAYLVEFSDFEVVGYLYIKWDQYDVSTQNPYAKHLSEMVEDMSKIDPSVKIGTSPTFNLKDGYAYIPGSPYTLITVHGDGFLFGFAYKSKMKFRNVDVNDLIKKISWSL